MPHNGELQPKLQPQTVTGSTRVRVSSIGRSRRHTDGMAKPLTLIGHPSTGPRRMRFHLELADLTIATGEFGWALPSPRSFGIAYRVHTIRLYDWI